MGTLHQCSSCNADFSPLGERVCTRCDAKKRLNEFPRAPLANRGGGFAYICKECERARSKAKYQANKERIHKQQAEANRTVLHFGNDEKFGETWKALHILMTKIEVSRTWLCLNG